MIEKIEPFPLIPSLLRSSALQKKIVPFIGSGVSQLGGCPGWDGFAKGALSYFLEKGMINHAQLDQISKMPARVKLSFALELEKKHGILIDFNKTLRLAGAKQKIGDKFYTDLAALATTFVTTNYDTLLDEIPPVAFGSNTISSNPPILKRQLFFKKEDLNIVNLDCENAVFHIHGSVHHRSSMILTTPQYLERYASHSIRQGTNENPFLTFLEFLFKLKNVLFIGYGLEEFEILEYVLQKGGCQGTEQEPQHYVLKGFFSHELELARSFESHFRQFGIGLLPYSRDHHDRDQLIKVIDYLAKEIPAGPGLVLSEQLEMEKLLK